MIKNLDFTGFFCCKYATSFIYFIIAKFINKKFYCIDVKGSLILIIIKNIR
jgi:hypothetical protein